MSTSHQATVTAAGPELRSSARVEAALRLDIPGARWDRSQHVHTQNISRGGLMFRVPSPVTLPGSADVIVTLPDGKSVTITGEIRHAARIEGSREIEVGIQFKSLSAEHDAALSAALAQ